MKKMRWASLLLAFLLVLSGCSAAPENAGTDGENSGIDWEDESGNGGESVSADFAKTFDEMFTDRDQKTDYDAEAAAHITLNGNTASADSDTVQISGNTVTVTDEGTYIFSGTFSGMIVVNADEKDKPQLVFDGVSVTSETSAALYILEADKVFLTLAAGSENTLKNGGSFVAIDENNIDGALFSKQDLTINGEGSLSIVSPAGHGIVCKDDLVLTGGSIDVTSSSHAIDANDSVRVTKTDLTLAAGKDGIHAENSDDATLGFVYIQDGMLGITAEGDGISAGCTMQIEGGTFDILTGGGWENGEQQTSDNWGMMGGGMGGNKGGMGRPGRSAEDPGAQNTAAETETDDSSTSIKGIKSEYGMLINGGIFTIDSADDAVHSNTAITVNGGSFAIKTGDDGVHAEETLTVTNGTFTISESYEGLEALDIKLTGGSYTIYANDDGLNAAGGTDQSGFGGRGGDMFGGGMGMDTGGSIVIDGGTFYVNVSGDAIDSNGSLEINGGDMVVSCPTQGDTAVLDFGEGSTGNINGGTFIGTGALQMAVTFSTTSEQGVIAVNVGTQTAGSHIEITDEDGNVMLEFEPDQDFAILIWSHPDIVKGETYTLTIGDLSGDVEAY